MIRWTVEYARNGFRCTLTLEGEVSREVLDKADAALDWLAAHGATPTVPISTPTPGMTEKAAPTLSDGRPDPAWCPIHNVTMKRRERDGQVWYSHKVGDTWCRGQAK